MRKKTETEQNIQNTQPVSKKKVVVAVIAGLAILSSLVYCKHKLDSIDQCVQKNIVNDYVCKVVGVSPDNEMFAVQCLTE